jgi:hypothetical protein
MSESDLYRKQRVAIESVAQTISVMEDEVVTQIEEPDLDTADGQTAIQASDERAEPSPG